MNVWNLVTVIVLLNVTCAHAHDRRVAKVGHATYELKVTDEPEKLRFSLVLTSKDKRDICIERASWPDDKGATQTGPYVYSLRTERGTIFPHAPTVEADCWGPACLTRILPGRSLRGFIAYSEFDDPLRVKSLTKRELRVNIIPSVCESEPTRREKRRTK